ncbi:MAG: transcription initiation protein [Acidobacteria bacterium]|nr:MAG: transcription initiation protein [Acidobacteriota bacterium]
MRFIMFMYPNVSEENYMPDAKMVAAMMKYNEELAKAGALIALDGLHPVSKGARVHFSGSKPTVTDGPFIESKELVGGYWIIQAKSKDEAVKWARRCPAQEGNMIEIRQIFEMSDFPEDVQKAADSSAVRAQIEKQKH